MDELTIYSVVCLMLYIKRSRKKRHYLTKLSLNPQTSAWSTLYSAKNDGAYIDTMGFDVKSFHLLHDAMTSGISNPHPMMGGRAKTLDGYASLGTY